MTWLESHVDFERVAPNRQAVPTLDPIIDTLAMLADPQLDYPTVHITGTNGKGTTTTLTSALLSATGLRVGTFTSPDLHAINERIAVNGEPIDDEEFITLLQRLADVESVSGIALTRFELLTAAAFLHFSDEGVDVAVIEVGMGGTWDSTNIINSDVAVLTNVDLDHTAVLGTTIAEIASDKVGIFRADAHRHRGHDQRHRRGDRPTTGRRTRRRRCGCSSGTSCWNATNWPSAGERSRCARPTSATTRCSSRCTASTRASTPRRRSSPPRRSSDARLGEDVVTSTLAKARMPGRMELISRKPMIVVDGAHNPAGVKALVATLDGAFHVAGERRCVLGMLSGRDIDDMVEPLVALGFTEFHCCAPHSPRAVPANEVADAVRRHGGTAYEHPSAMAALAHARERSTDEDLIVVAGSLYLVAEVRGEVLRVRSRHLAVRTVRFLRRG